MRRKTVFQNIQMPFLHMSSNRYDFNDSMQTLRTETAISLSPWLIASTSSLK